MYAVRELDLEMINDLLAYEGKTFSDNFSNTGSSLCLRIDIKANKVYYQECYSQHGNFTGKNRYGDPRTDELHHPTPGLNTMSLEQFYGAAIGWVLVKDFPQIIWIPGRGFVYLRVVELRPMTVSLIK